MILPVEPPEGPPRFKGRIIRTHLDDFRCFSRKMGGGPGGLYGLGRAYRVVQDDPRCPGASWTEWVAHIHLKECVAGVVSTLLWEWVG